MTPPELDILNRLIDRLDKLQESVADDLAWMGQPPSSLAAFEAMASHLPGKLL